MTPEQIIENNILLAKFMGFIDNGSSEDGFLIHPNTNYDISISSLNYNSDWNWLMQVVDKIESIIVDEDNSFNVTIGATNYCVIQNSNGELYESIEDYGDSKLMTTYIACTAFVKWYNQNKGGN